MKYLSFSIILLYSITSYSQKWDHTYGNPNWYEGPSDIVKSYDKGYLVLGNTGYNDHGWIIKTDINGELLWDKYFGGPDQDPILEAVEQDIYGNIYLAGLMKFGQTIPTSIIFKMDSCGNLIWCKTIYTDNMDYNFINDILIYNDTTIICYAYHNEPDDENNNYLYNINSNNGDLRWKKPYASKSDYPLLDQSGGSRMYLFDEMLIIAGYCYTAYPNGDSNHYYLHPFFIGIDTTFEEKWVLPFGISDSLRGVALGAIPVSDSIIMGFGKRRLGSISHSLLMFFDYDGNELGYNMIENEQLGNNIISNTMSDMRWINDTFLFGSIAYQIDEDYINFCDVQTDTSGTVHKVEFVDFNAGGGGKSNMLKTFDNKYVVTTGYIEDGIGDIYLYKKNSDLEHDTIYPGIYTYDSLCNEQIISNTISLGGCDIITNIKDVPTLVEYNHNKKIVIITAFPNPVIGNQITFEFQNTQHHQNMELRCFNVFCELVFEERVYPYQGESKVNVQSWNSGIYVSLVYSEGKVVGQTKFVVQ